MVSWIIWTGKKVLDSSYGLGSAGQVSQLGVRDALIELR